MIRKKINNSGQTLVELIVAVAIIQIGILSVWSLFMFNFNAEREAETRIVGANLSREGIELLKNIRDSNWLKNDQGMIDSATGKVWSWDRGLSAGVYSASYDRESLDSSANSQLYSDPSGFFTNVLTASTTIYSRVIRLKPVCCVDANNDLKCDNTNYQIYSAEAGCGLKIGIDVVASTTWSQTGKPRQAVVEDIIYNWR